MSKKLSIVEMISISNEWGGMEQHVRDVSDGLSNRGHAVRVVCRDITLYKQRYGEVCPVHVLPIRNAVDPATILGLKKLIQDCKADIIHTHTSRDAWLGLFATKLAGRGKVVVTKHGPFPAKRDIVHTWFYNNLDAIICVSDYVRENFLGPAPRLSTEHVHRIYPGIDTIKFDEIYENGQKPDSLDRPFIICFVGRVTVEKGVHVLLKAVAQLKQRGLDVRVIIAGGVNPETPEYIDELHDLVATEEISEQVVFHGFTKNVAEVLIQSDVLVLPSIIPEASPLVLREAMLCGKPAIGTTLGGQAEIVKSGVTGYLVQPNSPIELANALDTLISNREIARTMGERGRTVAVEQFSINKMLTEIEECFYNLQNKDG